MIVSPSAGGIILAVIEGVGIAINRGVSSQYRPGECVRGVRVCVCVGGEGVCVCVKEVSVSTDYMYDHAVVYCLSCDLPPMSCDPLPPLSAVMPEVPDPHQLPPHPSQQQQHNKGGFQ